VLFLSTAVLRLDRGTRPRKSAANSYSGNLPERFTGLASGTVHLTTQGVGRDELLQHLAGKGELKLRDGRISGWDVDASMADGAPHEGASRWASEEVLSWCVIAASSFPGCALMVPRRLC